MISIVKSLFLGKGKSVSSVARPRDDALYHKERYIAENGTLPQRLRLARKAGTHPEILYYLAEHDKAPRIREALLKNKALPIQASTVLAKDSSEDVRILLVKRLVNLLPELSREEHSRLYAYAVQSLGLLAQDEVLKIRKALSNALKNHAYAPPQVAATLAKDMEREVSEPILRFCTALQDKDLLGILQNHPSDWVVEAIAQREKVHEKIARAVIGSGKRKAGALLIENKGAEISEDLYFEIIDMARDVPEWHEPLSRRPGLSSRAAKKLIQFADQSVRDVLVRRSDFDKETIEEIAGIFKRRLAFAAREDVQIQENLHEKALRLYKSGELDEATVSNGAAMMEPEFLYTALACLAHTDRALVEKIFALRAAKPVVAVCWRAGLSMRFALQLQKELVRVPHKELIYPRGGTDYPFTDEEMVWQLEFLGVKVA